MKSGSPPRRAPSASPRPWLGLLFAAVSALSAVMVLHKGLAYLPGEWRSDFEYYFHPQRVFLARWLQQGIFPFWNPHLFCGYPTVEIQQTALFYPFNTALLAVLPPVVSLVATVALHAVLCVVATQAALRFSLGIPCAGSMLGGIAYGLGSVVTYRIYAGHLTVLFAAAWVPLAVCSALAAALAPDGWSKRRHLAVSGVATGLVVLAGAPQYIFYTVWAQAVCIAVAALKQCRWQALITAPQVWGLGAILSAPQWLPALAYLQESARGISLGGSAPTWRTLVVAISEVLFPYPFGDGITSVHLQRRGIWDTAGFVGTVALVAALSGCLDRGRHLVKSGAGMAGVSVILLGIYLMAGGWLPGFAHFREPLKATILVSLGVAILGGCGMESLIMQGIRRPGTWAAGLVAIISVAGAALVTAAPVAVAAHAFHFSEIVSGAHPSVIELVERIESDPTFATGPMVKAMIISASVSAGILVVLLAVRRPTVVVALLTVLASGELALLHFKVASPRVPVAKTGWPPQVREEIEDYLQQPGSGRVIIPGAMSNAAQLIDGLCEPFGYDPLMPRLAGSRGVLRRSGQPEEDAKSAKDNSMAIGLRIADLQSSGPESVPQTERTYALERTSDEASWAELAAYVVAADFTHEFGPTPEGEHFINPEHADRIPPELRREAFSSDSTPTVAMTSAVRALATETPNEMRFEVESSAPAVLIVKTTFVPGWGVSFDGKAFASPAKANGWMLAAPIPPGRHDLVFRYRPVGFWLSCAMSWVGLFVAGLLLVSSGRRPEFCVVEGEHRGGAAEHWNRNEAS